MRSVVVLPAPLAPSRPVISPSRATKDTPSTRLFGAEGLVQILDLDHRATPRSWRSAVVVDERRRIAEQLQAARHRAPAGFRVSTKRCTRRGMQPAPMHPVSLSGCDQLPRIRQRARASAGRRRAVSPDRARRTASAPAATIPAARENPPAGCPSAISGRQPGHARSCRCRAASASSRPRRKQIDVLGAHHRQLQPLVI